MEQVPGPSALQGSLTGTRVTPHVEAGHSTSVPLRDPQTQHIEARPSALPASTRVTQLQWEAREAQAALRRVQGEEHQARTYLPPAESTSSTVAPAPPVTGPLPAASVLPAAPAGSTAPVASALPLAGPASPIIPASEGPFNCSICLEELRDPVTLTTCDHQYHLICIRAWYSERRRLNSNERIGCPMCRRPMGQLRTIEANGDYFVHDWVDPDPHSHPGPISPGQSAGIRAGMSLGQAIRQRLGGRDRPIVISPSDISMEDVYSIRTEDRDPPPARPSLSEGSRVEGTFGEVTHEGIRKTVAGAFAVGRGHSLLLKYHSQNADYPDLAAYSLVPAGDFRGAFNAYIQSNGVVFEKATIDGLDPSDWDSVTILGVASPLQRLGTTVDEYGNHYQNQPINRPVTRVFAVFSSRPTVPEGWYIQSDLIKKFGPSIVPDVQAHVIKTGQYRPIHPGPESIALRQRPRRVVAISQPIPRANPLSTYPPATPRATPPTNPSANPPTNPILTDPLTDEELVIILERRLQEARTRINRRARGQAPSESTL